MAHAAQAPAPQPIDPGAAQKFKEYLRNSYDGGQNGKTLFTASDIAEIIQKLLESSTPNFKPPSDSRQKAKLWRIKKRFRLVQIGDQHRLASAKGMLECLNMFR